MTSPYDAAFYIPPDAVRVSGRIDGRVSQVYLDPVNTERIYLLSEISKDGMLTLKYIYNDVLGTVTLLSSFTKAVLAETNSASGTVLRKEGQVSDRETSPYDSRDGSQIPGENRPLRTVPNSKDGEPRFTHYYRYAQGVHSSLELILEEGWVKGSVLIPSKVYDYFRGVVSVRTLDRSGNILKLESSAGVTRHFIYSRNRRLLTIEEADASGGLSFYDQVSNAKDWDLPPMNVNEDRGLFVLPDRGKEKLFTNIRYPLERVSLSDPRLREDDNEYRNTHFLLWLESAHPLRAGPAGGLL